MKDISHKILKLLDKNIGREYSIPEIMTSLNENRMNVVKGLAILETKELVRTRMKGRTTLYRGKRHSSS